MKTDTIKHTLPLGKVAWWGTRRIHAVELDLELRTQESASPKLTVDLEPVGRYVELSICGSVWNNLGSDIVSGGQNVDEVAKKIRTPRVKRIAEIWERWHLNGMKAGTRAQNEAVAQYWAGQERDALNYYERTCAHLESLGLLVDRGYKYGSAWLVEPLPEDVILEVLDLFDVPDTKRKEAA